jgi:hypothetical protein
MPIAETLRTRDTSKTEVSLFHDDMPTPSGDVDAEVLLCQGWATLTAPSTATWPLS